MVFSTFFSYSTDKTESPCKYSRQSMPQLFFRFPASRVVRVSIHLSMGLRNLLHLQVKIQRLAKFNLF